MIDPSLQHYRRAGLWGERVRYLERTSSTNDVALEAGRQGASEGLVIVAEEQSAGRGRLSRRWSAPPGQCLLLSLLFRPPEPFARHALRVPMLCGLALAAAVSEVTDVSVRLKWPNDLIVVRDDGGWRKVAGMLSEADVTSASGILIVGIGVNVNVPRAELGHLSPQATSLSAECGRPVARVALLDALLGHLESFTARQRQGWDPRPAWQAQLAWLGEVVEVHAPGGVVAGVAEGVDAEGALLLRCADGERRHFAVGDVSLRKGSSDLPYFKSGL